MNLENIFIVDVDGTIASCEGIRSPFDESKVHLDVPLPTIEVIQSLILNGHKIIYFSGRTDSSKLQTCKWISDNIIGAGSIIIHMRKTGDRRPDDVVKEEMYNTYIKDKYTVLGVFEDRLRVARLWYKLGLWVYNVNQGLSEF